MGAILSVVSMISQAASVIGAFAGNSGASGAIAKVTGAVQDAVGVVKALSPLVEKFGAGEEVTPEDVKDALAGKDAALAEFDRLIAEKSAAGGG